MSLEELGYSRVTTRTLKGKYKIVYWVSLLGLIGTIIGMAWNTWGLFNYLLYSLGNPMYQPVIGLGIMYRVISLAVNGVILIACYVVMRWARRKGELKSPRKQVKQFKEELERT